MPRLSRYPGGGTEALLARRIEYEREKRGLSYEAMAKAMTEAGCKIQGSAIFKIEKADPPRRITVDELAALAEIFEDGDVAKMLRSVDEVELERAGELLAKLQGRNRDLFVLMGSMFNDFVELAGVWQREEDIYNYVMSYFAQNPLGGSSKDAPTDQDDEPADGAFDALTFLLSDIAAKAWHAVSQVTLMYMNTLMAQERGEGPTEDELQEWVREWVARRELGTGMPDFPEAREQLIARVETWIERVRTEDVQHQEA